MSEDAAAELLEIEGSVEYNELVYAFTTYTSEDKGEYYEVCVTDDGEEDCCLCS